MSHFAVPTSFPTTSPVGLTSSVVGIPVKPSFCISNVFGSLPDLSEVRPIFLRKGLNTFSPLRSIEINNNLNFVLFNFSCNFERDGNSLIQGAHQVAQKFIMVQVFL